MLLLLSSALAATFVVNTVNDTGDLQRSDRVCLDLEGTCSLRAAIETANSTPAFDIIDLRSVTGTIYIDFRMRIETPMAIWGGGTIIVREPNASDYGDGPFVFDIRSGATAVHLRDLVLTATEPSQSGIRIGGAGAEDASTAVVLSNVDLVELDVGIDVRDASTLLVSGGILWGNGVAVNAWATPWSRADWVEITISDALLWENQTGLKVDRGNLTVRDSDLVDNTTHGVNYKGAGNLVVDRTVVNGSEIGIEMRTGDGEFEVVSFAENLQNLVVGDYYDGLDGTATLNHVTSGPTTEAGDCSLPAVQIYGPGVTVSNSILAAGACGTGPSCSTVDEWNYTTHSVTGAGLNLVASVGPYASPLCDTAGSPWAWETGFEEIQLDVGLDAAAYGRAYTSDALGTASVGLVYPLDPGGPAIDRTRPWGRKDLLGLPFTFDGDNDGTVNGDVGAIEYEAP